MCIVSDRSELDAILNEIWARIARQNPMQLAFTRPEDVLGPAKKIIFSLRQLGMSREAITEAAVTELVGDRGPFYRDRQTTHTESEAYEYKSGYKSPVS